MSRLPDLKKAQKKEFLPLFIYTLSILTLFVFLYGFFPLNYSPKLKQSRYKDRDGTFQQRYINKLGFIVIDALRCDFVLPSGGKNYMPFTSSSILKNESCYLVTKAHSPTVTMPRLKAITAGSVSSYIDVVMNFMTPAFEEENFVKIAVTNQLKLVFYGDDTWLKLFPKSFIRSEETKSFYTYDYVEVDDNVTRHIDDEFNRDDWDIIILHYLGLDHIGHTEGPNSALVKPKLLEMDNIIKKVHDNFKKLEINQGLKTMLVVTGDHGMKDSGSHGGVTYSEIMVPLISVGNPCAVLPGWPEDYIPLQIDLAPTLSTAFGLPIPVNSMGKIIPSLLHYAKKEEVLRHLELNRLQLSELKSTFTKVEEDSIKKELKLWLLDSHKNEKVIKNLTKKYFENLNKMSQELVTSNSDFKLLFLTCGVTFLWVFLILLLFKASKEFPKSRTCIHQLLIIGTILHAISLMSSSFIEEEHQTWYFFWATLWVFSFLQALNSAKTLQAFNKVKVLIPWIILALTHRILRKLNQTGDKWALLPDIKFYLYAEEKQLWLFLVFLLGIGMIFSCAVLEKCTVSQLFTCGMALLAVINYRISVGNFKLEYLTHLLPNGVLGVLVFWTFLSAFTIQTSCNKTPFYLVWLVFMSLPLRPHNVILLPIQVFTSKKFYTLFYRSDDLIWNNLAHVWLGNVFYFYQGNGNSLSNIDVAAGFIGIETYQPAYAGVIIAAHTFNSHILSFILSPKSDLLFVLSRLLPLTLYCSSVMFLLNHLFIWSVFSPKLLFESIISVLFLLMLAFDKLLDVWKTCHRGCFSI